MNEETKKSDQGQVKQESKEAKAPAPEEKPVTEKKEEMKEAGTHKKINRLTLKEVEKKIQETQEKMGGLASSFARQLLKRKEQLLASGPGTTE